ncbi:MULTISPECIES: MFS transporter [unclassified Sphingomonas]|uniref:MFS transporter n=1 Tax=unclassified Sphingomonas TaxID=196159 RepID=UPI002150E1F1|nr:MULTISPECIES: MFS transporter [unclassified Sphingomonas]MCR5871322.1 MFS transporter [Sphingomonas sp. J344]UUY00374.1 MFS transporter [Sphingomonas sp. J315]
MTTDNGSGGARRRGTGFILLVALANAGGVIAFLPLLSLLLPVKIAEIAGEARIGLFTATVIAGAIAASLSNIAFGWASDRALARGGTRRSWVVLGLALLGLSFAAVALAQTPTAIILAIILFQVAVNALLSPMFAIMADEVPGAQMGLAGGLIALGSPLASAVGALMIGLNLAGAGAQLGFVFGAVLICVVPLLRTPSRLAVPDSASAPPRLLGRDLAIAWTSRLLVQVAGNVLSLYLVYYFVSIDPDLSAAKQVGPIGQLMTIAYLLPLPVAVLLGRWSDRIGRRKPFLLAAAAVAAAGLLGLAVARDWGVAASAFALYAMGSSVFLSIHSGFAMQLLPSPDHRGRDLGLINLTNTLPALIGPALAWALSTPRDFGPVMLLLAALTLLGGGLVLAIRQQR